MKGLRKRREFKSSLQEILKDVMDNVEGVKAALITADTGQPIASVLPPDVDDWRFAAVTAALCSLSERAISEMGLGELDQLYVKGAKGYLLTLRADNETVLTVSTSKDFRLAPLLFKHYKPLHDEDKLERSIVSD